MSINLKYNNHSLNVLFQKFPVKLICVTEDKLVVPWPKRILVNGHWVEVTVGVCSKFRASLAGSASTVIPNRKVCKFIFKFIILHWIKILLKNKDEQEMTFQRSKLYR